MWLLKSSVFQLLLLALLTLAVFAAGLSGNFYFDDEWNVLRNSALQIESLNSQELWHAAMSGTAGPLGRPLATFTFAVNYFFSGLDPYYFKLTNLFIHIGCGVAICLLSLSLSRQLNFGNSQYRKLFAAMVAGLWLIHPLNLTPVLYVVQRMTSMSALFCVLGMLAYVHARQTPKDLHLRSVLLLFVTYAVCFPLALLSKENAVLLPAYCFLIELIFFRFRDSSGAKNKPVVGLHLVLVLIPGLLILGYLLVSPEWVLGGYVRRDFSMFERVLTESRILVFYLSQLLLPMNSELALFHDDIVISSGLFSPLTTVLSIALILGLLVLAAFQLKRRPVIAFAILFFFCAHLLESTILALELAHEHRNYLASFSVVYACAYYLIVLLEYSTKKGSLAAVLVIAFLGVTTTIRAAVWGNPAIQAWQEVMDHPDSPRANYGIGKRYAIYASGLADSEQKREAVRQASDYFEKSTMLRDSYTDGLFGLLMLEGIEGFRVDQMFIDLLLTRLAEGPFNNNNYNYLNALFSCIEARECQFSNDSPSDNIVDKIMTACQRNPSFAGRHKQAILTRYQTYVAQK